MTFGSTDTVVMVKPTIENARKIIYKADAPFYAWVYDKNGNNLGSINNEAGNETHEHTYNADLGYVRIYNESTAGFRYNISHWEFQ